MARDCAKVEVLGRGSVVVAGSACGGGRSSLLELKEQSRIWPATFVAGPAEILQSSCTATECGLLVVWRVIFGGVKLWGGLITQTNQRPLGSGSFHVLDRRKATAPKRPGRVLACGARGMGPPRHQAECRQPHHQPWRRGPHRGHSSVSTCPGATSARWDPGTCDCSRLQARDSSSQGASRTEAHASPSISQTQPTIVSRIAAGEKGP